MGDSLNLTRKTALRVNNNEMHCLQKFITGRNEVVAKVMVLHVSVILLTGGRGSPGRPPRHQADTLPPGRENHPPDQADTPQDQADTPPAGRTLPGPGRHPQGRETPRDQADTPPPGRETPRQGDLPGRENPPTMQTSPPPRKKTAAYGQ